MHGEKEEKNGFYSTNLDWPWVYKPSFKVDNNLLIILTWSRQIQKAIKEKQT